MAKFIAPIAPEYEESAMNELMGFINPTVGITATAAKSGIIKDALRELSYLLREPVTTRSGEIFKSPQRLGLGLKELEGIRNQWLPGIKSAREGLGYLENVPTTESLYSGIRSVGGRLDLGDTAARYYPGMENILFATGLKAKKPTTYTQTMLHELFHPKLKKFPASIEKDLFHYQPNMAQQFMEMNTKTPVETRLLKRVLEPSELLTETAAQRVYKTLPQSIDNPTSKILRFEEYKNWPSSASSYLDELMQKIMR